ncbi:MAG TPA: hypothetical protein VGJ99_00715 [Actinomycetota bacterium]
MANDTNALCGCGTIYVAFMNQYDPGVQLFTSHDGGDTWSLPVTMNGGLTYMDKPILVISPSGQDVYVAFNHKFDNMVVASHDYGRSFLPPQKVNEDHLWWYANGGDYAPNGDVYFALDGESSVSGHGHDFDGPVHVALLRCSLGDDAVVREPHAHLLRGRRTAAALSGPGMLPGLLRRHRLDRHRCDRPHGLRLHVLRPTERAEEALRAYLGRWRALDPHHSHPNECPR